MPRLGRVFQGRTDELTLAALLLVGAVLSALPRTAVTPVVRDVIASGNSVFIGLFGWAFDLSDTYRENEVLRRQVTDLSLTATRMEEVRLQNERFRALLEWEEERRVEILTGAEVIREEMGR